MGVAAESLLRTMALGALVQMAGKRGHLSISCGLGVEVEVSQDYVAQGCYLDKPGGCSPGTQWRPPRRAGPRCGARGLCRSSCGRGSPARSLESRTTRGPRRPSPRSPRAGRCPRRAGDPPPGLRVEGQRSAAPAQLRLPATPTPPRATPLPPRSAPQGGGWGG